MALLIALTGTESAFECTRSRLTAEPHRLLTGQLTHFDRPHLVWDLLVFGVLGTRCERLSPTRTRATLGLSLGIIPVAVLLASPELTTFRGLSGIDNALFGLLAALLLRRGLAERRIALIAASGLAMLSVGFKSLLEWKTGIPVFATGGNYVVLPIAHLTGFAVGTSIGALPWREWVARRFSTSRLGHACCPRDPAPI